jgi:hypothetical protein
MFYGERFRKAEDHLAAEVGTRSLFFISAKDYVFIVKPAQDVSPKLVQLDIEAYLMSKNLALLPLPAPLRKLSAMGCGHKRREPRRKQPDQQDTRR